MPAEVVVTTSGAGDMAVSKTTPTSRIFFLDNLKVLLAFLVVLDHAAQPYVPAVAWVIPTSEPQSAIDAFVITMFLIVISSFFMGLFFDDFGLFRAVVIREKRCREVHEGQAGKTGRTVTDIHGCCLPGARLCAVR